MTETDINQETVNLSDTGLEDTELIYTVVNDIVTPPKKQSCAMGYIEEDGSVRWILPENHRGKSQ